MIFFRFSLRHNNNSGIILIVVLWLLMILSIMAIGLSRQIGVEIQLTRYALAKTQSRAAALSGLAYAMARIARDNGLAGGAEGDTLYRCGFILDQDKTPADLFEDIPVGDNRFSIERPIGRGSALKTAVFGFGDEQSRLNLNAVGPQNDGILINLLMLLGQEQDVAEEIATAVVDWRDIDDAPLNPAYGAENDYYLSLERPYTCKNGAFDSVEELTAVRGVTPEIFEQVRPFLTVIPEGGALRINFDTAPHEILQAVARHYSGSYTNAEVMDADSLVEKVLMHRRGDDGQAATADDRPVKLASMPLNAKERVIALSMQRHQARSARYLRIRVRGEEPQSGITTVIEAVVDRNDLTILSWRRR